ncbi:MAG TPA: protein-disulfide reductase DsbD domain-containing protein [Thermoanaerobaculia bacterium]
MGRPALILLMLLTAVSLAPGRALGIAGEWASNEQSRVRLITPYRVTPRDGEIRLGLHFSLAPGWHVYWKNSGDAGFPPVVVFGKAEGLGEPELLWPAPRRFELPGDLVALGYEKEVVYPVRAALSGATGDALKLSADVDYLVCEVDCIPYRYTLSLDQPLGEAAETDPETAPLVATWWDRLPVTAERLAGVDTRATVDASRPAAPVLEVRVRGARAGSEPPGLFLEVHEDFDAGKPEARPAGDGVVFRVPLRLREAGKPLPAETVFAWTATGLVHQGRPVSLEARREVPVRAAASASAPVETSRPVTTTLMAVASTLFALWLWGLLDLGLKERPPHKVREALGFAAAALILWTLYALARQVTFEGLAWIELVLLAMTLFAWLRHRAVRRSAVSFLWILGLAACAAAAPWLADRNRLPASLETVPSVAAAAEPAA